VFDGDVHALKMSDGGGAGNFNFPPGRVAGEGPNLECGDKSPFSDGETCLPIPKRGPVRALQIKAHQLRVRLETVPATFRGADRR